MIGPKLFEDEEREAILDKMGPLEEKASEADKPLLELAQQSTILSDQYGDDLEAATKEHDDVELKTKRAKKEISPFNPEIALDHISRVHVVCEKAEHPAYEQVDAHASAYVKAIAEVTSGIADKIDHHLEAYVQLLDLGLIEMPF